MVPLASQELPYTDCLAGKAGFAVFYQHVGANASLCRMSNPPMARDSWQVAYGDNALSFSPGPDGVLTVTMTGTTGARLETKDSVLFGFFQIDAMVSGASGVVTAFVTRSSRVYPNSAVSDFSEIDWEVCNGNPCPANSWWLHSFTKARSYGEHMITASDYKKRLNITGTNSAMFITYGINWQPGFVAWYANGKLVEVRRAGDPVAWSDAGTKSFSLSYKVPNLPSHQAISMWTDPNGWAGQIDVSKGPYVSSFKQLRRILCDQPLPVTGPAAQLAMGPAWLYNRTEPVPLEQIPAVLSTFRGNASTTQQQQSGSNMLVQESFEAASTAFTKSVMAPAVATIDFSSSAMPAAGAKCAAVTVSTPTPAEAWRVQMYSNMTSLAGNSTYTVMADMASTCGSATVLFYWNSGPPSYLNLVGSAAQVTVGSSYATLTLGSVTTAAAGTYRMQLDFGAVPAGCTVYVDNVMAAMEANMVVQLAAASSTFEAGTLTSYTGQVLAPASGTINMQSTASPYAGTAGAAVTVTNSTPSEPWRIQLQSGFVGLAAGQTYTVSIQMRATAANTPVGFSWSSGAPSYIELPGSAKQVVVGTTYALYSFVVDTPVAVDDLGMFRVHLDLAGAAAGTTVFLDSVVATMQ
eukprot:gene14229-14374_t